MPRAPKWSPVEDQFLVTQYLDAPDMGSVRAALPGRSLSAIYRRASTLRSKGWIDSAPRYGPHPRKYDRNDAFFQGGFRACYWAGFIAADGCLLPTNGESDPSVVRIRLAVRDLNHLESFKAATEFTGPVAIYDRGGTCSIAVAGAWTWVHDLGVRFSLTQRKSLTLQPPNLTDDEEIVAFIAGLIDGDGCITEGWRKPNAASGEVNPQHVATIDLCGTEAVMTWVKEHMDRLIPADRMSKVNFYASGLARLKFGGRRAYQLLALLPDGLPLLARKWDKLTGGD